MKQILALALIVLAGAAYGAEFRNAPGFVTGHSRTDSNHVTHFYDGANRVTGSARTDVNGVTTFHDAAGRVMGTMRR
jgi:hypothetical protein